MLYGCSAVGRKKEIRLVSFEDRTHPQVFRLIQFFPHLLLSCQKSKKKSPAKCGAFFSFHIIYCTDNLLIETL